MSDATKGHMSWPFLLKDLDLRRASVTRRLPVREQGPHGKRGQWIVSLNQELILPQGLLMPSRETVDHFLSLLLVCVLNENNWSLCFIRVAVCQSIMHVSLGVFGLGSNKDVCALT